MSEQAGRGKPGEGAADDAPSRRTFVVVAAAGTCAIAATIGVPAAMFVAAPLSMAAGKGERLRFVVGKLDDLEVGVPKKASVVGDEVDAWTRAKQRRLGAVWLLRVGDREVRALSVICPHLGCGVELSADAKGFACPCHDSAFDLQGQRVAGPSPRAMDPLPVEIGASGEIAIVFKRFRTGVASVEEIG